MFYTKFSTLEKCGLGKSFILWIKILLIDQESFVINGGTVTKYFSLGRGSLQGDTILAFLALEVLFTLIKSKPEIEGLTIFDYRLYSAYTDDTSFFLKVIISIKNMVEKHLIFLYFSRLKPNLKKLWIRVLESWKGFKRKSLVCVV